MSIIINSEQVNGKEVKGTPLPRFNKSTSASQILAKVLKTQFKIMNWAVAKCPSIKLIIMGESVPSLLDSGSMVSLMWQDYFKAYSGHC